MAKRIIGLDIGVSHIQVVHLENSEVIKTHEIENSENALQELAKSNWLKGDILVTGLGGADAQVRSLDVPFSNAKKIELILASLLDAQLPLEVDDLVLSWFLQTKKEDEQQKILAAFAKRASIKPFLEQLESSGANPNILTLKSAGLYELLKIELKEPGKTVALVDMGAHSTSICVGNLNHLLAARSVLKSDLSAVLHELRQTFLNIEEPVREIILVGGKALEANIASQFSKILEIPVRVLKPFSLSPAMALALSYALIGQNPSEKKNRFNLRKDEFAFRSRVKLVSSRTRTLSIWAAIFLVLLTTNYGIRRYFLGSQIDSLITQEKSLCEQVMGKQSDKRKAGKKSNCLSAMKKSITQDSQDQIPKRDAVDYYLEVSKDLPTDIKIKITELDIGNGGVRLSGDTVDFESVDIIVEALSKSRCFKKVEKGRARQIESGVSFQISMDINCEGNAS